MFILLFISILFVSPILGYAWVWKQLNKQAHIPDFAKLILTLSGTYFIPYFIILPLILNTIYFTAFTIVWGLMLFWGFLAPISTFIYLASIEQVSSEKRKITPNIAPKRLILIGFIILANFLPLFAYSVKLGDCYYQSLAEAQPLIQALEDYRAEHGLYPENFRLAGLYTLPTPACQEGNYSWYDGYCEFAWYGNDLLESAKGQGSVELYLFVWFIGGLYFGDCYGGLS